MSCLRVSPGRPDLLSSAGLLVVGLTLALAVSGCPDVAGIVGTDGDTENEEIDSIFPDGDCDGPDCLDLEDIDLDDVDVVPSSRLLVDPATLVVDFGSICMGGDCGDAYITLRVQGNDPVTIFDIAFDQNTPSDFQFALCGDADPTTWTFPFTLNPAAAAFQIPVRVEPQAAGVRSGAVNIVSSAGGLRRIQLMTQYKGRAIVERSTNAISFGQVQVRGEPKCIAVAVRNQPDPPGDSCKVLLVESLLLETAPDPNLYIESSGNSVIPPAQETVVQVCCAPREEGNFRNVLVIDTNADGGSNVYEPPCGVELGQDCGLVEIPVDCQGVMPRLTVTPPDVIDFGEVPVGRPIPASVPLLFENPGQINVTITSIALDPQGSQSFSLEGCVNLVNAPIRPGGDASCNVLYLPAFSTTDLSTLTIRSTDAQSPQLQLQVRGRGVTTNVRWEPTQLNYGDVAIGAQRELFFTVTNLGTATLRVEEITIPSTSEFYLNAVDAALLPQVLPGNLTGQPTSQAYRIVCQPRTEGTKNATALIRTNDPGLPRIQIPLTCRGTTPHLLLELLLSDGTPDPSFVDTVDFGEVRIGETAERVLRITNTGFAPLLVSGIGLGVGTSGEYDFEPEAFPPIANGEQKSLRVTLSPRRNSGPRPGELRFESNDVSKQRIDLVLKAEVIDPRIQIQPVTSPTQPAMFTNVFHMAESTPITFRVFNVGSGILDVSAVVKGFGNSNRFRVQNAQYVRREDGTPVAVPMNVDGVFLDDRGRTRTIPLRSVSDNPQPGAATDSLSFDVVYTPSGEQQSHILNIEVHSDDIQAPRAGVFVQGIGETCGPCLHEIDGRYPWCEYQCCFRGRELCDTPLPGQTAVDENCDGKINEGFGLTDEFGQPVPCRGLGVCEVITGRLECDPRDPTRVVCSVHPGGSEYARYAQTDICDGLDNDCDGIVDNARDFYRYRDQDTRYKPGDLCVALGYVCGVGTLECDSTKPGGRDLRCSTDFGGTDWASVGQPERCDGLDNNCNGTVDEGPLPGGRWPTRDGITARVADSCRGTGSCGDLVGEYICYRNTRDPANDAQMVVCSANDDGLGGMEFCDGLDNNCNNQVDEGTFRAPDGSYVAKGAACRGRGACAAFGLGQWVCNPDDRNAVLCSTELPVSQGGHASIEVCDGIDNDCDGVIDNDNNRPDVEFERLGLPCDGLGECGRGVYECDAADPQKRRVICSTDPGGSAYGGGVELCNRRDDNCNGRIDETFDVGAACIGLGVCGIGRLECTPDGFSTRCDVNYGGSNYQGSAEVCDGLDNDCDGLVDEDWNISAPCEGTGECGPGVWQCRTRFERMCSTDPGGRNDQSRPELCDGLDNDCDGLTDEDFQVGAVCEGRGACGPGYVVCLTPTTAGCSSDEPTLPTYEGTPEICDGIDNNCDGRIDEGFNTVSDANNCGRCGNSCVQPTNQSNANMTCVDSACRVASCKQINDQGVTRTYVDLDGDWRNGCECLDEAFDPPNTCDRAVQTQPYRIYDDGTQQVCFTGFIGAGNPDVDWFTFVAHDDQDNETSGNEFSLRVAFTPESNRTNEYRFMVLKNSCDENIQANKLCTDGTNFHFFLNYRDGRLGENPCAARINECTPGFPAGSTNGPQCPGNQRYATTELERRNWCNDWSTKNGGTARAVPIFIKVYRDANRPPSCQPYEICITNARD